MIRVYGEGRGFRVVAGVENDPEFLATNPAGFIPAAPRAGAATP